MFPEIRFEAIRHVFGSRNLHPHPISNTTVPRTPSWGSCGGDRQVDIKEFNSTLHETKYHYKHLDLTAMEFKMMMKTQHRRDQSNAWFFSKQYMRCLRNMLPRFHQFVTTDKLVADIDGTVLL